MKAHLLFFYDYFYPGYKAGGPIQSLTNLILNLQSDFEISVITSAYDLNERVPYTGIVYNSWVKVELPGSQKPVNVLYWNGKANNEDYLSCIAQVKPDVVYFNNIYSGTFFRVPLNFFKKAKQSPKLVICPRGMLQNGALAVKPFKKKIYLAYLRLTGVLNEACWHATNKEEAEDILKFFPKNRGITIAENIPKPPFDQLNEIDKQPGSLRLVFLSLITEKKNLKLLLQVVKEANEGITLDIYGPVKDEAYWKECQVLINEVGSRVNYKGDVLPIKVQETIAQYHALILLTKGENFGHALYESLSVGRPIITSHYTPWINLTNQFAGWNVGINGVDDSIEILNKLLLLDNKEFSKFCMGAHKMSLAYFTGLETKTKYKSLFSKVINND